MKTRLISFFLSVVLAAFFTACDHKPVPLVFADIAQNLGVEVPGGENLVINRDFIRPGGGEKKARSLEGKYRGRVLRLEVIRGVSADEAARIRDIRVRMILSSFSNIPSPYPGAVTNKVSIPDSLRPKRVSLIRDGKALTLYILPANRRFVYGAMTEDIAAYKAGLFFLYDPSEKTLYRFDYFVPRNDIAGDEIQAFFKGIRLRSAKVPARAIPTEATREQSGMGKAEPGASLSMLAGKFRDYNLILVGFEPLGARHVSSYGYRRRTTPNLDAFAEKSFLFEKAISPSSWTLPAFMSWFTSMYPSRHKVLNKYSTYTAEKKVLANLAALSPSAVTLAQVLHDNGYRTAGFTGGASLSRDFGFDQGFDTYFDRKRFGGFDLTMPQAVNWLQEHRDKRFFLFVEGFDMHGLFPLDRTHLLRFLDNVPYRGKLGGGEDEYWQFRNRSLEQADLGLQGEDLRFLKAVYDSKIYEADRRFGMFISEVKKMGLLDKTIVIVSSGSGNEYMEHGRIDHGFSLYEELIDVPFIIRVPGMHGRIAQQVRTLDIMPTVIDLLDLKTGDAVREQMQGVSLVPVMAGEKLTLAGVSETDYLQHSFKRSIRTDDGWKLIVSLDTEERELYNLNDDPGEKVNLVGKYGRRAYELEQALFTCLRRGEGG